MADDRRRHRRRRIKVKKKNTTEKVLTASVGDRGASVGLRKKNPATGRSTSYGTTVGPRGFSGSARTTGKGGTTFHASINKPFAKKGNPYKPKTSIDVGISIPLGRKKR